ncbi:hypothetical protein OkiPb00163_11530 [Escherichia coli]
MIPIEINGIAILLSLIEKLPLLYRIAIIAPKTNSQIRLCMVKFIYPKPSIFGLSNTPAIDGKANSVMKNHNI